MPDSVLDILKLVLLVLLYLFFARVLWAVWSEVRQPANVRRGNEFAPTPGIPQPAPAPAAVAGPAPASAATGSKRGSDVPSRLLVLEPKQRKGTAYAVGERGFTIGREDGNALRITDDTYLSGHHARFDYVDGKLMVTDLGSRNGTFLNGARLSDPRPVRTGDRIQIGYTVFEAQR
jgi:pSer/pThr/pTyr-binding forkhead associated (FHA) protein